MKLRVLQVGLGWLGCRLARDLRASGRGTVVAAVDPSPGIAGRALGAVLGDGDDTTDPVVVVARTEQVDPALAIDAAIVSTTSDLVAAAATFRSLLERGLAVVSTCEPLVYPWLRHEALAREPHDLATRRGGRLLGTGVNPGFVMDALPLFVSGACLSVRRVSISRVQDAAGRRQPFQRKIGVGLSPEAARAGLESGRLGHVGLAESLHFVAATIGMRLERVDEESEPVVALAPVESVYGQVPPGRVVGVRQTARGYDGQACRIELVFRAALGEPDAEDRVVIEGEPPIDLRIVGGVHGDVATSAIVLNALPRVIAAPPGLLSMTTLPLLHAAASPVGTPHRPDCGPGPDLG